MTLTEGARLNHCEIPSPLAENDNAFAALNKSLENRERDLSQIKVDPRLELCATTALKLCCGASDSERDRR